jgi:hypothetical protein
MYLPDCSLAERVSVCGPEGRSGHEEKPEQEGDLGMRGTWE